MDYSILLQYIRPELLVLVIVLYFIGMGLKKSKYVKDELIPLILGTISTILCAIYVVSVSDVPRDYREVLGMVFNIVIQGVCCAAASVYANQMYKQLNKMNTQETVESEDSL